MTLWAESFIPESAQDLEDLATASWLSETLFAALELGVFEALGDLEVPVEELAARCGAAPEAFSRFAQALASLGLLSLREGRAACTTVARRHLLPGQPGYLGHSLRYRERLARTWPGLPRAVRSGRSPIAPPLEESEDSYRGRVRDYLLAMDDVARHKARHVADLLDLRDVGEHTVLDLAGGAGAVAAELLRRNPGWTGLVADLPEVVAEARQVWADRGLKRAPDRHGAARLDFLGLDLLTAAPPGEGRWGVVIASNVVHVYGPTEARRVLGLAAGALADDGVLVVHDFLSGGRDLGPLKAALFDIHMLLHTYQGRTYEGTWVRRHLEARGLASVGPVAMEGEDTALIVAARRAEALSRALLPHGGTCPEPGP